MLSEPASAGCGDDGVRDEASAITRRDLFSRRFDRPLPAADHWLRVHRPAMACRFEVTLSGEDGSLIPAAREALDEAERIESVLTLFRETSELVRVNQQAPLGPTPVSRPMFDLLRLCEEMHAQTEGAFDVTSAPLSRCWGFLARNGRIPSPEEIATAQAQVGMPHVALDETLGTVCFTRPGMELNLGSIGKGYAVGRMGRLLRERGTRHALVSAAGSSVFALGGRGTGWDIDLRSRQVRRTQLARLHLREGALATSGAGEQFLEVDGRRYGHVLDPRTGWPAAGVLSASVVTADPAVADALSTAFLVGGLGLAERYCAAHRDVLALVTPDDGSEQLRVFGAYPGAVVEAA